MASKSDLDLEMEVLDELVGSVSGKCETRSMMEDMVKSELETNRFTIINLPHDHIKEEEQTTEDKDTKVDAAITSNQMKYFEDSVDAHSETDVGFINLHRSGHFGGTAVIGNIWDGAENTVYDNIEPMTESATNGLSNCRVSKPYKCDVCDKEFAYSNSLVIHARIHTGEKPYTCVICNKAFSNTSNLKRHMQTHTCAREKPYKCGFCDKGFKTRHNLKDHIRTHTGEKPYQCYICNVRFAQRTTLTNHIRTHTGEKPYTCDICDKGFAQKGNLTGHLRTHRREKPDQYQVCMR